MDKCFPSLEVLLMNLVKPDLNWTLADFIAFPSQLGRCRATHSQFGWIPIRPFPGRSCLCWDVTVAWGCSSPGLGSPGQSGFGVCVEDGEGGTLWPWGTLPEPLVSLTGAFCVATALDTLSLQHVVVLACVTSPGLGDTYCGWGGLFYLKSRPLFLNSSEFSLLFVVWITHSWGVGWEWAEWDEHMQGSLVGQGWGSATQTPWEGRKIFWFCLSFALPGCSH